jgi:hypothetical protein
MKWRLLMKIAIATFATLPIVQPSLGRASFDLENSWSAEHIKSLPPEI